MSLVKCKECGTQVSTKAKTCPKCGAVAPKKTSLFTWIILIFIIFVSYVAITSPTPTSTRTTSQARQPSSASTQANSTGNRSTSSTSPTATRHGWTVKTSRDEMTGKANHHATSPIASPTKRMGFPYHDVKAWLGVGCDENKEWAYFGFTTAPNLNDTEVEDGYNVINTRLKWDEAIHNMTLIQSWGDKFLSFQRNDNAIPKIAHYSTVLLELDWHGEQSTYFRFSLNGSSNALAIIRKKCSSD